MKNKNTKFIKTIDKDMRKKLKSLGFEEITQPNSEAYCFINNEKIVFEDTEKKCIYSDILCI